MSNKKTTVLLNEEPKTEKSTETLPLFPPTISDPSNVLNSKRYMKGLIGYQSPQEIFAPVFELLKKLNCKISLQGDSIVKNQNEDGTENIAYGRLNITARYEISEEIFYEIGVLAAFDLGIPKLKIYRGARTSACLNLNIWGADDIQKFDVSQGIEISSVNNYIRSISIKIAETKKFVDDLKAVKIPQENLATIIGLLTLKTIEGKTANGINSITSAINLLTDEKSKYFYKQENFNAWLLYNSLTEGYNEKVSFFDIPEKSFQTFKLIKNICLS